MKVLGTPQIDNSDSFLACLQMNLEQGESVETCENCHCQYLITPYWKEPLCMHCSNKRKTYGESARERNRSYGRKYARERREK